MATPRSRWRACSRRRSAPARANAKPGSGRRNESARNGRRSTERWSPPPPNRRGSAFAGDASFGYTIAKIGPAARGRINAVTVVNNNSSGNQSKRGFDRVYGGVQTEQARELWTFSKVNFARLAQDMGAIGMRV